MPNQPTRRPRNQPTRNPRSYVGYIRLTKDELTTAQANQRKGGYPSLSSYLRSKALNDTSSPDRDFERSLLQAHMRIAGVIEKGSPEVHPKILAMDEIKQMLRELVKS